MAIKDSLERTAALRSLRAQISEQAVLVQGALGDLMRVGGSLPNAAQSLGQRNGSFRTTDLRRWFTEAEQEELWNIVRGLLTYRNRLEHDMWLSFYTNDIAPEGVMGLGEKHMTNTNSASIELILKAFTVVADQALALASVLLRDRDQDIDIEKYLDPIREAAAALSRDVSPWWRWDSSEGMPGAVTSKPDSESRG